MLASVASMIDQFNMENIRLLQKQGFEVHVAANFEFGNTSSKSRVSEFKLELKRLNVKVNHVNFSRKMTDIRSNIKAYIEIKELMKSNQYEFVHCHSPIGGVIGRLAGHKTKTFVIYTAHGFHFFKGAPLINWLLYYPVEKYLARYTDILITINNEDYENAIKKRFKAKKIELIDGVGVNLKKFKPQTIEEKNRLRNEYGYKEDDFILIYAGELNYNKNQSLLFKVIALLNEEIPEIMLLLPGTGDLLEDYQSEVTELGINKHVEFLGYRNDVPSLMLLSDIAVSAARREGLPVNVMEAMATGLALVVTDCRGNRDLVADGVNGYIIEMDDADGFAAAISKLHDAADLRKTMAEHSLQLIEKYSIERVMEEMERVYAIKGV